MLATAQALVSRCPELREVIAFDRWDALLESGDIAKPALPKVRSTDPVMIQYTSGTTGFPKGALLHHRGLVNNGAHTADRAGIPDGAIQVTTMPLFHTGGCVCCVLGAISRRATQVLLEAFDPGLVIELLDTYRGNAMLGVPTMLVAMMEHPSFATADLSSMKAIYSGGSTVPASIVTALEQRLGAAFTIVFGQTECSPVALMTWATDTITRPKPSARRCRTSRSRSSIRTPDRPFRSARSAKSARAAITSCTDISRTRRRRRRRSTPTAGCIPGISGRWMAGAIAPSRED
jgi:fatty-acyl-CoA synthase